jgi:hypothetical protein
MLGLEPTGLSPKSGAMLYRRSTTPLRITQPVQAIHTRGEVA